MNRPIAEKTEAGQPAPAGSAALIPTKRPPSPPRLDALVADDPENLATNWQALTPTEQAEAKEAMEYMGISVRHARTILRSYGGGKYLRRGIGAALALTFEFSSLEEAQDALSWLRKNSQDKKHPIEIRLEMIKAMAPILDRVRQLAESSLEIGRTFDLQQKAAVSLPPVQKVQVGVSVNNFPPLAKLPTRPVLDDSLGDKR